MGSFLQRDRDLVGGERDIWVRRGLFALAPIVAVLAIFNVSVSTRRGSKAAANAATLKLHAPERGRGGLLYEARFEIQTQSSLDNAVLVLAPG
jgi:hypothetical protein